jgi:arsenate reductase-like glutaredoxin family protein
MRLAKGLGGSLSALVDLRHPDASQAPTEADVQPWLAADAARIRAPILLTPKGALVGFRERAWREFLDIGRGR